MSRADRLAAVGAILATVAYRFVLADLRWLPRYDCITLVALLVGIFRMLSTASPRARTIAVHAITQVLLFAFLEHLWLLGYEGRNAVFGGILPWSDSHDFYDDALRLVHGQRFTEVSSKRPIFSALLAALLKGTGGDLRIALAAFAVLGGWAVATATLELWRTHGARAAFVVFLILLFFERRWTGFIQTEHVGLPLGAVGFALFWRANGLAETDPARARRLALVGLFAIATGLMARAGAFFVVPALAIWGARKLAKDRRATFLVYAACAAFAGFALHKAVLGATGSGVTFSDYPGIAYGLVHGEDYTFLVQTHPELAKLGVAERVPEAWRIVTADAAAHPMLVAEGLAKSGAGLFVSPFGMFSYVWTNPDDHVMEDGAAVRASMQEHGLLGPIVLWQRTLGTYSIANAGAMGLLGGAFVIGTMVAIVVVFVKRKKTPELSLLRHAIAGVILSAPFTPPWITSGMQVQTVTLAFVAAVPGAVLLGRRRTESEEDEPPPARDRLAFVPFAFAGVVGLVVAWLRLAPSVVPACASGGHLVTLYRDSEVVVSASRSRELRSKALGDLTYSLRFLSKHNPELTDSIKPYLAPGTVYISAFDACDLHAKILVDDTHLLPRGSRGARGDDWQPIDAVALATPKVLRVVQRPVEP